MPPAAGTAPKKAYPTSRDKYELIEVIGTGVSSVVWRAKCLPLDEVVAVKVLDLEQCNSTLEEIRRETQAMSLFSHPNVVPSYGSFVTGQHLWLIMPYLKGGSFANVMKSCYVEGLDENVICIVIREVLQALEYIHKNGSIHRDVKAGNILVDDKGNVMLADFGVTAVNFGDRSKSRQTFVGTPCWMAPEVMEQVGGYDWRADMWSLGITCLELAHGHAPFAKYPPMKVLLMTLQNPPPTLEVEGDKGKFTKYFKEVVAMCLQKDPSKRPSASKLLEHKFFKGAKSQDWFLNSFVKKLPPLEERVKGIQVREEKRKKAGEAEKEVLSSSEYVRGISCWNFNLDDIKAQAAMEDAKERHSHDRPPSLNTSVKQRERRGRFEIIDDDEDSSIDEATGKKLVSSPRFREANSSAGPGRKDMKQKGRFEIYEDAPDEKAAGARGERVTSVSATVVGRGRNGPASVPGTRAPQEAAEPGLKRDCLPQLQALLVSSLHQQQGIRRLINQIQGKGSGDTGSMPRHGSGHNLASADSSSVAVAEAEKEMHNLVVDLQQRNHVLEEKNEALQKRNLELERQLNKYKQQELQEEEAADADDDD